MEASTTETNRPPWGGFQTFLNFIGQLHEDRPVPQVLDRAVMTGRGGSTRTELYVALRFFGLMDEEKKPTRALLDLVEDPSADALRPFIEGRYKSLIDLDLRTATPNQVQDALTQMGSTPSTVTRARTFFLKGAEHVGVEVGKTLQTAPTPPRRKSSRKGRKATKEDDAPPPPPPPTDPLAALHPAIITLVKSLPEFADNAEKPEFATADREAWFAYAKATFNLIYSRSADDAVAGASDDEAPW